jgi:hypothetical protein
MWHLSRACWSHFDLTPLPPSLQSCSLSWYKSIEAKKELLDEAVKTNDGNCIMAVILFIRKTVDQCKLLQCDPLNKDQCAM